MAELADATALGAVGATRGGSNPLPPSHSGARISTLRAHTGARRRACAGQTTDRYFLGCTSTLREGRGWLSRRSAPRVRSSTGSPCECVTESACSGQGLAWKATPQFFMPTYVPTGLAGFVRGKEDCRLDHTVHWWVDGSAGWLRASGGRPHVARNACGSGQPGSYVALAAAGHASHGRGCSSVVERHVANVNVVGSNPITRSLFLHDVVFGGSRVCAVNAGHETSSEWPRAARRDGPAWGIAPTRSALARKSPAAGRRRRASRGRMVNRRDVRV